MRLTYPFATHVDVATTETKDHDVVGSYFAPSAAAKDDQAVSLLYSTLPHIIQRRLPKLRSLRQAASTYTLPQGHHGVASDVSTESVGTDATPPPSYRTQPSSPALLSESDIEDDVLEQYISAPEPATPVARAGEDAGLAKSGRYGFSLLKLAIEEAASPAPSEAVGRRLYIDGVGYLLRGLPTDLSADEEMVIRTALPEKLAAQTASDQLGSEQRVSKTEAHDAKATLLRRTVSAATLYTILILSVLIPYLHYALRRLWAFDQQHKLSTRLYTQAALLAQLLSAQVLAVMALAWDMNEGQLRTACRDAGVWLLRDVTGGANEGVRKAVEMLRLGEKDGTSARIENQRSRMSL